MGSKPFLAIKSYLILVQFRVKILVSIEFPQKLMGSAEPIEPMLTRPLALQDYDKNQHKY